jgi:predicted alpha/beta hydrolase
MKTPDPDDLKMPHESIHSLMQAFEQAWLELKHQKENEHEIELSHCDQRQAPETSR